MRDVLTSTRFWILALILVAGAVFVCLGKYDANSYMANAAALLAGFGVGKAGGTIGVSGQNAGGPLLVFILVVSLFLSGCGILSRPTTPRSLPQVKAVELWDQAKCERTQTRKNWLVGIDAALGVLSGGGGIAAAFPELEKYRLAAAIPSLVLGIGAAVMAPFVASATKDYADHCVEGAP